jgi:HSP20 family protein
MRNIDRDFSLIRTDRRVVPSGRLWNPAADVYRSSEGWIVKVDLAGVCMEELEIEIRD